MPVCHFFGGQETSQIHKELATVDVVVLLHRQIALHLLLQKKGQYGLRFLINLEGVCYQTHTKQ